MTPSLRLTWVRSSRAGSEPATTAKLWFWLVISTWPGGQVLDRVVAAVVPERQLDGLGAERVAEQLVAEADAEHRHRRRAARRSPRPADGDRGRVAGTVGEEHAVGSAGEHVGGGVVRRTTSTVPSRRGGAGSCA